MIRFSFEVAGVQILDRAFNRLEKHMVDLRSVWPAVAGEFYAIEEGQFQSEGAKGASGKWAPLSKAYARYKEVAFPGQPILRASGSLYESMTSPDAPDSIYRVTRDELAIGSKVPYLRAHQRGNPKRKLPARPIISVTERDKRRLQKVIQRELVRFTREAGFQVEERAA